ncbi:MAG: Obg family GTPase CgtA, partial [Bombilactobacillus mellis]|nr:Obg family GTPase CgtA [Bombilactobacillus mellis]
KIYHFAPDDKKELKVQRLDEHTYQVLSPRVSELLQRSNLDYQDGIMRFARKLQRLGVDDALIQAGAQTGDTVVIDDFEFEFM